MCTFVCFQLKQQGFVHIDALDPSEGMLEKAKARSLYENYICDYITDKQLDIQESKYKLKLILEAHQ